VRQEGAVLKQEADSGVHEALDLRSYSKGPYTSFKLPLHPIRTFPTLWCSRHLKPILAHSARKQGVLLEFRKQIHPIYRANPFTIQVMPVKDIEREPRRDTLENIVEYCEKNDVVALAIDAQLTITLSEERGLRTSDKELKELLPKNYGKWVMAINSLAGSQGDMSRRSLMFVILPEYKTLRRKVQDLRRGKRLPASRTG
jgi:hypothetical protein